MGMYSNFVLAEPSNLTVDLSKVDIDCEFLEIKRVITLEEF